MLTNAHALARFGYTAERLAAERAKIQTLIDAFQAQEPAKDQAQHATAVTLKPLLRDTAF